MTRFDDDERARFAELVASRAGDATHCLRLAAPEKCAEMSDVAVKQAASRMTRREDVVVSREDRERKFADLAALPLEGWLKFMRRKMLAVEADALENRQDFTEKAVEISRREKAVCVEYGEVVENMPVDELRALVGALVMLGAELSGAKKNAGMTMRDMMSAGEQLYSMGVPGAKAAKFQVLVVNSDGEKVGGRKAASVPDREEFRMVRMPDGDEVFVHWTSLLKGQAIAQEEFRKSPHNCEAPGCRECFWKLHCAPPDDAPQEG